MTWRMIYANLSSCRLEFFQNLFLKGKLQARALPGDWPQLVVIPDLLYPMTHGDTGFLETSCLGTHPVLRSSLGQPAVSCWRTRYQGTIRMAGLQARAPQTVHRNDLSLLLKCRLSLSESGMTLRFCIFNNIPGIFKTAGVPRWTARL